MDAKTIKEYAQGFTCKARKVAHLKNEDDWQRGSTAWRITLGYQGRKYSLRYWTGAAITETPTAFDVLACVLMDALSYHNSSGFNDWCDELGYNSDSRKAYRLWLKVVKQVQRLRAFIGDEYDDAIYLDEE